MNYCAYFIKYPKKVTNFALFSTDLKWIPPQVGPQIVILLLCTLNSHDTYSCNLPTNIHSKWTVASERLGREMSQFSDINCRTTAVATCKCRRPLNCGNSWRCRCHSCFQIRSHSRCLSRSLSRRRRRCLCRCIFIPLKLCAAYATAAAAAAVATMAQRLMQHAAWLWLMARYKPRVASASSCRSDWVKYATTLGFSMLWWTRLKIWSDCESAQRLY